MVSFNKLKRLIAFLLAIILSTSMIYIPSYAENAIPLIRRVNIFEGRNLTIFGKTHYSMGYYQESTDQGAYPTFCLEPGKRMPNGESVRLEATVPAGRLPFHRK